MRTVEKNMIATINSGKSRTFGNTRIACAGGLVQVFLHGNMICKMSPESVSLSLAGWATPTTKSRVNALCNAFTKSSGVHTKAFKVYGFGEANPLDTREWFTFPRL